ncbi:hypothetical protein [Mesorhizobium sp. CO1-1-8]|uniref:hypothetical protein n=1 Tax=Mesorhizobium sp. CO1-1-8 TaxID=2876631 RepID=UPI001CD0E8A6|nr:hypothetical protein [Mesorhizobium sp. CO1-1-8]MBZ9772447.1 hypothetical protein [Mesorhizobium sp. CO1-1-8]
MSDDDQRPVLWRDEDLGLTLRRGDEVTLSKSTYDTAIEALKAREFEQAARLIEYTFEEAQEPQDVYASWSKLVPQFLLDNGVDPAIIAGEEQRIATLIRHRDGRPFDFESGWERHRALIAEAAACCRAEESDAAIVAIENARTYWQDDHDRKCDWVCEILAAIPRHLGEERVVDFWDLGMSVWYPNYRRFRLENQDWNLSSRQLVDMGILALRGHLTGPGRRGDIAIRDEGDCIALEFAPCGSGGRTFNTASDGTSPRLEPPYNHAVVQGNHDWAWNKAGVCLYCTHCCRLGQQKSAEMLGFPARVISPPIWPQARDKAVCTWRIYKDPSLVPEEAYTQIGKSPPAVAAVSTSPRQTSGHRSGK